MNLMPKTFEEKPYNVCIDCAHIGKNCDGPNFLAMSTDRWCEWCHLRKEYLGWTNAKVAEISGVSKTSVDRIMSGNVKDLRNTTMQDVTKALVNGTWGQYPCANSAASEKETIYVDNPDLVARCERLQAALENVNAQHKADIDEAYAADRKQIDFLLKQIDFKESQLKEKDRLLRDRYDFLKRKDRIIMGLVAALVITIVAIIAALIADKMNPDMGFFWTLPK